ncbi:MAG: GDP-mannose 4,6-dehydratase [Anaerolineales bacterium]|nr:GDP-mannose 4,6-dehydratase [Anaerolineales bacterium]
MRVLITGIAGFAGSHLAERLVKGGYTVAGTRLPGESLANLAAVRGTVELIQCDITRRSDVLDAVKEAEPEWIFHLAGQASVGDSFHNPGLTIDVNVKGTANILEAARLQKNPARTLIVTSAEVYGILTEAELPVTESAPFAPVHSYAVSKIAVHYLGQAYFQTYHVPVIEARPFNHIGPRQRPGFVVPDFASQIAGIMLGQREPVIKVGNLTPRRDFTDVRDVVEAYELLARQAEPGKVYHICSGRAYSIQQVLDGLLSFCNKPVAIKTDPKLARPARMPILLGSAERLRSLGWKPQTPIEQTMEDTLAYWKQMLQTV